MAPVACAVASALMFWLRDSYWPLAWIAPVPLLWLAYGTRSLATLILTTTATVLLWGLLITAQLAVAAGIGILPHMLLQVGLTIVVYVACFCAARYAHRVLSPVGALLLFPAITTAVSYVWMVGSNGDAAASAAYSQVDVPILIQSASLFGLWGIEFLLALFANGLALGMRSPQTARFYIGSVIAVAATNVAFGAIRFHTPPSESLRVAAAAQDLPLMSALPTGAAAVSPISRSYAMEARQLAGLGAKVIVFPELTAVLTPQWYAPALAPIQTAAHETGTSISIGFAEISTTEQMRNVALTIHPDGTIIRYVKRHTLLPLDRSLPGTVDGVLGNGLALAICKDLDFPATIRSDAQQGIRLMLVPAADFESDGWTHARMSIMRGVENGFAVVRAARNGLVTVADDRGRVIAHDHTNPQHITYVIADVPMGSGSTLYLRFGNYFAWACVVLAIALLVAAYRLNTFKQASGAQAAL